MKLRLKLVGLIMAIIGLSACSIDSASKKLSKQLHSSYDKDGQQVELAGFLALSKTEFIKGGVLTVGLDNVAGQSTGSLATIKIKFGQGANMVYMPEKFKLSDLEIYDNAGNKHDGYLTEIKITGTVKYTNKNWKESIDRKNKGGIGASLAAKTKKRAQAAADKREEEKGDPNDYSFYIVVDKIEIPE